MSMTTAYRDQRSCAAKQADEYENDATAALQAVTASGEPVTADTIVAVVKALLTIGERVNDGTIQVADAVSDVAVTLEAARSDRAQQAIDLAEQVEQLTGSVDYLATLVRMGLPLRKRLTLSWRGRRWQARHGHLDGGSVTSQD